ncbi:MAG: DUF1232 domain-containing protein [Mariniphaga sp.]|nr:DUF1232 domain-containing protein [Mariniphaga sp.]
MRIVVKLIEWAKELKLQSRILQLVYKDERTPLKVKILIWITLGYLFSPIDLIPDFIPVIGYLDDLIIVPLLIALTINLIPKIVWDDASILVNSEPEIKWKKNWLIITGITLLWLLCLLWLLKLGVHYYKSIEGPAKL